VALGRSIAERGKQGEEERPSGVAARDGKTGASQLAGPRTERGRTGPLGPEMKEGEFFFLFLFFF